MKARIAVPALILAAAAAAIIAWPYASARASFDDLAESAAATDGTGGLCVDFAQLAGENPDIVGWVQVPGTGIDYPVVQGTEDEYLHLAFDGTDSRAGTPFLDPLNSADFSDKVSFVYGHSLLDGSMFSELANYSEQGYFDGHGEIVLATPEKVLRLEPWAAVRTSGYDGTLHVGEFADDGEWEAYKAYVAGCAAASSGRGAGDIGSLVCLVTCSYNSFNERTLVFCAEKTAEE